MAKKAAPTKTEYDIGYAYRYCEPNQLWILVEADTQVNYEKTCINFLAKFSEFLPLDSTGIIKNVNVPSSAKVKKTVNLEYKGPYKFIPSIAHEGFMSVRVKDKNAVFVLTVEILGKLPSEKQFTLKKLEYEVFYDIKEGKFSANKGRYYSPKNKLKPIITLVD